jgi:hypothetical protein
MNPMSVDRLWAMPSKDTFSIPPVMGFVRGFLKPGMVVVDPFARNSRLGGHYTNDLNPDTAADFHMMADAFLTTLLDDGVVADVVQFDPPYTLRQVKEVYEQFGKWQFSDTQNAQRWTVERDLVARLVAPGGTVLSFGYSTTCMGKKRGFEIVAIRIVSHGPAHNDTLCTAERNRDR